MSDDKPCGSIGPGRPSKYNPEFCALLIVHMKNGYSYKSFAAVAKVNPDTLFEWEKHHEDWCDAKDMAVSMGLLFWEKLGIDGTSGKLPGFNASTWIFNMKNRHGYRDRQPDEEPPSPIINNNFSVTKEDVEERLKSLAEKASKK